MADTRATEQDYPLDDERLAELQASMEPLVERMVAERLELKASEERQHRAERLVSLADALLDGAGPFALGELIEWKPGLRNRRFPGYGEALVVIEVLDEKLYPDKDSGSQYFREPLDIAAGLLDEEGEFAVYHFDSRRFQRYSGPGR